LVFSPGEPLDTVGLASAEEHVEEGRPSMKRTMRILGLALTMSVPAVAAANGDEQRSQAPAGPRANSATIVMSSQVTAWLQGGYHAEVSIQPRIDRLEIGAVISGTDVRGPAKGVVFDVDGDEDSLDMRLRWAASISARYRFTGARSGAWASVAAGAEEFRVRVTDTEDRGVRDRNGFIGLTGGYRWFPWTRRGIFVQPQLAVNVLVFRPDVRVIGGTSYRLRRVHPSPSLTLGWAF
jgi:hypothetical protein